MAIFCAARTGLLYLIDGAIINSGTTYKEAGVDIDAGEALVEAIKPLARSTRRPGTDTALGGFGALFDLKAAGFQDPILVSSTDGVGTKLKVAIDAKYHDTVGIDLVAMCVNDIIVQGAEPLFFLDYFATGKLAVSQATAVVAGIAEGCRQAGCALIGGETAEMPGMYGKGDYDLAGFSVGAVERGQLLPLPNVQPEDLILGLAASGIHSNGYSLVRKLVVESGSSYSDPAPFADGKKMLGEALLTPTRIYVKSCLSAIRSGGVKALAHITGGGLIENIPRVLPPGTIAEIDAKTWNYLPVFRWLQTQGKIAPQEMARTFNCGLGVILVVSAERANALTQLLTAAGEQVYAIGKIVPNASGNAEPQTRILNLEDAWRT